MSVQRRVRLGLLYLSKWCGLFRLSRRLTRHGLRILCYHGFADGDLLRFRSSLFIRPDTFEKRLEALKAGQFKVMRLDEALDALDDGQLPSGSIVITVDDAFESFLTDAWPLLSRFGYPVTTYVTTYYCINRVPVFRLVVRYMLWRTRAAALDLWSLDVGLSGVFPLTEASQRSQAEDFIISHGEALPSEEERTALAGRLGDLLGVSYEDVAGSRAFNIASPADLTEFVKSGVDVQLHTHRHRLPRSQAAVRREIEDNRSVLEPIARKPLNHLCYPSGIWSPDLWPWLATLGVASATTCDVGFNYRDTPRLGLKRILDAEDVALIEFEAEVSGYKDLLRRLLRRRGGSGGKGSADRAIPLRNTD